MTILFDLTAIYDHLTGIERYAINISTNLIVNHPEDEYILLFKNEIHSEYISICEQDNVRYEIIGGCNKLFFNQIKLPMFLRKYKADYYVFLAFVSPYFFKKGKIINTIHDMVVWDMPDTTKGLFSIYGKVTIRRASKISNKIITVSKFSKSRIEDILRPRMPVEVIYNGVSVHFLKKKTFADEEEIRTKYNIPNKYILCLSTLEPRKNLKLLIRAYKELVSEGKIESDLVLAGRKGWKLNEAIGDEKELGKHIHITGFVDDCDLPYIYKNAQVFVFPSFYEGFGIPIIEAMSQGTIVVGSNITSIPEVMGNAGFLFESDNVEDLKKRLLEVTLLSAEEREVYTSIGIERCQLFSWEKEAEKLYQLF